MDKRARRRDGFPRTPFVLSVTDKCAGFTLLMPMFDTSVKLVIKEFSSMVKGYGDKGLGSGGVDG